MFDIKQWLADAPKQNDFDITLGKETFQCRRLTGVQRERYNTLRNGGDVNTSPRAYLLSCCLLDGRTGEAVSYVDAVRFVEKFDFLSMKLEVEILQRTGETVEAESELWGAAEKNSETTHSGSPDGNGAATSASTRK